MTSTMLTTDCPGWCTEHTVIPDEGDGEAGWHQSRTLQAGGVDVQVLDETGQVEVLIEGPGGELRLPLEQIDALVGGLRWAQISVERDSDIDIGPVV